MWFLNLKEEEELIDIRNDGNFKLMHKQMPLRRVLDQNSKRNILTLERKLLCFCFNFPRHTYVRVDFPF